MKNMVYHAGLTFILIRFVQGPNPKNYTGLPLNYVHSEARV